MKQVNKKVLKVVERVMRKEGILVSTCGVPVQ